ncbi:hypothetical protein M1105_07165 [Limibaculum sp. FT325]|uniref:sensor histidine kinase n=1 Tax=Thermohalobaculum sediminis TaxID=2939436 RepID=UPI0020BEC492|nr:histidine kinase dimerization/phospho-acceptor domain-containing protein [Limibaculum sediminis]MCL5776764.1 hypothetical protein [Limibaculum sediminis]
MARWRPRGGFLIALALLGMVALVALAYLGQRRDARSLEALGADNTLWHVAGLDRELLRFTRAVARASAARPGTERAARIAEVSFRFDLLWSRMVASTSGPIGARLAAVDSSAVLPGLMELLHRHEARAAAFDPGDAGGNEAMLAEFEAFERAVNGLAALADRAEQSRTQEIHGAMLASSVAIKGAGILALVLSGLIVAAHRRQARRDAGRLREIRAQAMRAEAASLTRERFLAMVSHELRTPMNGVLGMISLLRASQLGPVQALYARHACRSGHIMLGAIEALLDMSELRDGRLSLDHAEFSLAELARAIEDRLEPLAHPGAVLPRVDPGDRPAARHAGDLRRTAQLAAQMLFHAGDTLGATDCHCRLGTVGAQLVIAITITDRTRLRWPVETILDPTTLGGCGLAGDASGLTVARELIALMRGSASVAHLDGGACELAIAIPAPAACGAAPRRRGGAHLGAGAAASPPQSSAGTAADTGAARCGR